MFKIINTGIAIFCGCKLERLGERKREKEGGSEPEGGAERGRRNLTCALVFTVYIGSLILCSVASADYSFVCLFVCFVFILSLRSEREPNLESNRLNPSVHLRREC